MAIIQEKGRHDDPHLNLKKALCFEHLELHVSSRRRRTSATSAAASRRRGVTAAAAATVGVLPLRRIIRVLAARLAAPAAAVLSAARVVSPAVLVGSVVAAVIPPSVVAAIASTIMIRGTTTVVSL